MSNTFSIRPTIVARMVGAETVILDLESGTYFGLDPVGARIWTLLNTGKSLAQVCDVMVEEYEVTRENLESDALALARELFDKKLIELV